MWWPHQDTLGPGCGPARSLSAACHPLTHNMEHSPGATLYGGDSRVLLGTPQLVRAMMIAHFFR